MPLRQFAHRRCAGFVAWSTLNLRAYSESSSSSSRWLRPQRLRGNCVQGRLRCTLGVSLARGPDRAARMPARLNLVRRLRWRGQGGRAECDSAYARWFKVDHQTWPPHLRFPNSLSETLFRADWVATEAICLSEVCWRGRMVDFEPAGMCRMEGGVFVLASPTRAHGQL